MRNIALGLLLLILALSACDKGNDQEEPEQSLDFVSLVAATYNLKAGETTNIKATATGSNLIYYWSATQGDILGSGSDVIYATSICQTGKNKITCKITNGNQSESKTIEINVVD
jgi:hypothetical protein